MNRNSRKFKGILLSNCDIAELVLGNRKAESTVRRVWKEYKNKGHYRTIIGTDPLAKGSIDTPKKKRKIRDGNKFVITSAQNNTHLHEGFLSSLEVYCEEEGAELLVSPFYYNKTGYQGGKGGCHWFDSRIKPYLVNESVQLAEDLIFCGELNILPTAVNPLSGLQNYTGDSSGIVPHAKMELQPLPSPKYDRARSLYTTGTCTQRNYKQQKAGQKAEWDHIFGALVVEIDSDGDWFVRQLHCESQTGNFYDLTKYYTPQGVCPKVHSVSAIQFGDIHRDKLRQEVADMCWNDEDSLSGVLRPEYTFVEDLHDQARRNHHNIKDCYYLFRQFTDKKECVREEVGLSVNLLKEIGKYSSNVLVVESNHDLALERFLKEQNYKTDPVNAIFFLELQLLNYKAMARGESLQTFKTACELVEGGTLEGVTFLKEDEPFRLHGIEMSNHGHLGNNGARGGASSFIKQGIKMNVGHSHSPLIKSGLYQAGACVLVEDAGYAKGGSSWAVGHIITYPNGKRTIITCSNGKWRA